MGFFAVFLISTLISLTLTAVAYILQPSAPHQANAKASAFSDFDFPQSEDGTPQSVAFGDVWKEDWTVLWVGDYNTQAVKSSQLSATGPGYSLAMGVYGGASPYGGGGAGGSAPPMIPTYVPVNII